MVRPVRCKNRMNANFRGSTCSTSGKGGKSARTRRGFFTVWSGCGLDHWPFDLILPKIAGPPNYLKMNFWKCLVTPTFETYSVRSRCKVWLKFLHWPTSYYVHEMVMLRQCILVKTSSVTLTFDLMTLKPNQFVARLNICARSCGSAFSGSGATTFTFFSVITSWPWPLTNGLLSVISSTWTC